MQDDPFHLLLIEALNLMHPRFAGAQGLTYSSEEVSEPIAAKKEREQFLVRELYHQFRHLWDKALPVRLGLGHILVQADPLSPPGRKPELLFWQIGENGLQDSRLAAVSVVIVSNIEALEADRSLLQKYRIDLGYRYAIAILIGTTLEERPSLLSPGDSITNIYYDTTKRSAFVLD